MQSKPMIVIIWILLALVATLSGLLLWMTHPSQSKLLRSNGLLTIYSGHNKPVVRPKTLRVLTYNIGFTSGIHNNTTTFPTQKEVKENLAKIIEEIKASDADVVCLQETDVNADRTFNTDQVDQIARACTYPYAMVAYNWDLRWLPFPSMWNIKAQYGKTLSGQTILSKYPITKFQVFPLEKPQSHSWAYNQFYPQKMLQVATLEFDRQHVVQIVNLHLEAYDKFNRAKQAANVLDILKKKNLDKGTIIAGDLNAVDLRYLSWLKVTDEPLAQYTEDPTISLFQEQYKEALDPEGISQSDYKNHFTFPSNHPNRQLDHIFYNASGLKLISAKVNQAAGTASDHLPLLGVFQLLDKDK